tara:strand:+ start:481 stop:1179 length:699 start_codon:yes stop_codon:yes gene_type:complete
MGYKPKEWGKSYDFTPEMLVYYAEVQALENSIEKGFNEKLNPVGDLGPLASTDSKQETIRVNDDKFHEYLSLEGGENTIGYGHKLTEGERKSGKFSKGLSKPKALDLLGKDLFEAYKGAYNQYVNQWPRLSFKQKEEKWDELSNDAKVALTDLNFNIGNIKDYKGIFKTAVKTGQIEEIRNAISNRGYKGVGQSNFLEERNNLIIKKIGSSVRSSDETSLINNWKKEDNIFA